MAFLVSVRLRYVTPRNNLKGRKLMTVSELIEELEKLDPDSTVHTTVDLDHFVIDEVTTDDDGNNVFLLTGDSVSFDDEE